MISRGSAFTSAATFSRASSTARFRVPAVRVAARRRVAELLAQIRNHLVHHARIDRRRRAVVHVNGQVGSVVVHQLLRGRHVRWLLGSLIRLRCCLQIAAPSRTGHVENGIGPFRHDARGFDRRRLVAPVAQHRRRAFARTLLVDQILQRHRIEVLDHLLVQRGPQFVRHAVAVVLFRALARALAAALGGVDRFVDRDDDVGDGDVLRRGAPRL